MTFDQTSSSPPHQPPKALYILRGRTKHSCKEKLQRPRALTPENFTVFPRGYTSPVEVDIDLQQAPPCLSQAGGHFSMMGSARETWLGVGASEGYDKARGRGKGDKVVSFTTLLPCSIHLPLVPSHLCKVLPMTPTLQMRVQIRGLPLTRCDCGQVSQQL